MDSNQSQYGDNYDELDYFPSQLIKDIVRNILLNAELQLCIEKSVKQAMLPIAAEVYMKHAQHGSNEADAALDMLMLGFQLGFEAGHIDGHVCAEGVVPDFPEQIMFQDKRDDCQGFDED